jgi:hypothetical protein
MAGLGVEKPKYLNEHNIYVRSGMATLNQLKACVSKFKEELTKSSSPELRKLAKCEIESNIVTNMKGETQHFGYLWVELPEVYWILCGYNPDGTERVRVVEDTKPNTHIDLDNIDFSAIDLNTITSMTAKEPAKIVENLPPLIPFPGYEYTEEQRLSTYNYLKEEEDRRAISEGREPNNIEMPKYGYFELDRSSTVSLEKDKNPSILRGEVPKCVTFTMLKNSFAKFAMSFTNTDKAKFEEIHSGKDRGPSSKVEVYNCGAHFRIKIFPTHIRDRPNYKVVTIEYPLSGYATGIFAIQMRRKTVFTNPNPAPGESKEVTCIFDFFRERKF